MCIRVDLFKINSITVAVSIVKMLHFAPHSYCTIGDIFYYPPQLQQLLSQQPFEIQLITTTKTQQRNDNNKNNYLL